MNEIYGGIEAGGTKFICAVGSSPDDIRAEIRFPTAQPAETLPKAIKFFKEQEKKHGKLTAVGIASFGPVDPDPNSPFFGFATSTPKPGWANTDIVGPVRKALNVPVGFDTDVNGAALGEWRWGAAQGLNTFIYLTIGTGIGGGGMVNGEPVHGMLHPEMGHILVPHDWQADPFPGVCPYHGDCLEGLATGPSVEKRWGQRGETLPVNHPAWQLEAHYIALALVNYILIMSPQRLILGGGVMQQMQLFPPIRSEVQKLLKGYVRMPQILEKIDDYIVPPGLGGRAGVMGAIALAYRAAGKD
jgi:fructokinase